MRTILVVDDEQQIRELVRLSLELVTDWKITQASSGEEALARVRIEAPDAILLDYHMPELDGLGTLVRLREEPAHRTIPILIYTADRHAFAGKPLPEGLAGVIFKPFNPAALKEKLESLW
ncbi:MAG: response regulator [Vulcanimicrobiota bacterium]